MLLRRILERSTYGRVLPYDCKAIVGKALLLPLRQGQAAGEEQSGTKHDH